MGGPFVFTGRSRAKPLSNMVFLMTLRRMHRADITVHGHRSSVRDWAAGGRRDIEPDAIPTPGQRDFAC